MTLARRSAESAPPDAAIGPVSVRLADDVAALFTRRAEWNALVERSPGASVFQTCEWHASWWSAFGRDLTPIVVVAEARDGRLLGVVPLVLRERRWLGRRWRVAELMGGDASDYADVIVDPDARSVLAPMLHWLAADRRWDALRLTHLVGPSETATAVAGFFGARGYATDRRPDANAPTRLFHDRVEDRRLLEKKSLKRHHNYFARSGRLEFETVTDAPAIHARLDALFRMHIERWTGTDSPSLFLDERQRRFYRRMVATVAPAGWLRYSTVTLDGAAIAAHLGFEYGNRFVWYKPAFDVAHARHSPGEVLLRYLLGVALERNLEEFDFATGDEAFKRRFANHVRQTEAVHVFRRALPLHLCRLWWHASAVVKRSAWIRRAGRRVRNRLHEAHRAGRP